MINVIFVTFVIYLKKKSFMNFLWKLFEKFEILQQNYCFEKKNILEQKLQFYDEISKFWDVLDFVT